MTIHVCPKCNGEKRIDEDAFKKLCECSGVEKLNMLRKVDYRNLCTKCRAAIWQEKRECPTCEGEGFVKS